MRDSRSVGVTGAFAQALSMALDDDARFARCPNGLDAAILAVIARRLPGRLSQTSITPAMGMPRFGVLLTNTS